MESPESPPSMTNTAENNPPSANPDPSKSTPIVKIDPIGCCMLVFRHLFQIVMIMITIFLGCVFAWLIYTRFLRLAVRMGTTVIVTTGAQSIGTGIQVLDGMMQMQISNAAEALKRIDNVTDSFDSMREDVFASNVRFNPLVIGAGFMNDDENGMLLYPDIKGESEDFYSLHGRDGSSCFQEWTQDQKGREICVPGKFVAELVDDKKMGVPIRVSIQNIDHEAVLWIWEREFNEPEGVQGKIFVITSPKFFNLALQRIASMLDNYFGAFAMLDNGLILVQSPVGDSTDGLKKSFLFMQLQSATNATDHPNAIVNQLSNHYFDNGRLNRIVETSINSQRIAYSASESTIGNQTVIAVAWVNLSGIEDRWNEIGPKQIPIYIPLAILLGGGLWGVLTLVNGICCAVYKWA